MRAVGRAAKERAVLALALNREGAAGALMGILIGKRIACLLHHIGQSVLSAVDHLTVGGFVQMMIEDHDPDGVRAALAGDIRPQRDAAIDANREAGFREWTGEHVLMCPLNADSGESDLVHDFGELVQSERCIPRSHVSSFPSRV